MVRKIRNGTVIDHISAGNALNVLKILGIRGSEGYRVAIVMNVESKKLGLKDIVKVEGRELAPKEVNMIALIAPKATINIIRDYKVVKKVRVKLPRIIDGIVKCSNPNCITNRPREHVKPRFKVVSEEPLILQCLYCERYTTREDVVKQFKQL